MISDVLSDAVHEIEMYEREMPECYRDIAPAIADVKTAMRNLQRFLDCPPTATAQAGIVKEVNND